MPYITILLGFILGIFVTSKLSLKLSPFIFYMYSLVIGTILLTTILHFTSLLLPFPQAVVTGQLFSAFLITLFTILSKTNPRRYFPRPTGIDRYLAGLLLVFGIALWVLFDTHIIQEKSGHMFTGESTYGDLPFHISTISQIAFSYQYPPQNPFYTGLPLVYPYFVNLYSAVLVYEGMSLRSAIIFPGMFLGLSIIVLLYDFAYTITKDKLKSLFTTLLYLLNGGLGFFFFFKEHPTISTILQALTNPTTKKEYSHLLDQNIQWGNFLTRMIVPERSILLGIPAGIIILRLIFFRNNTKLSYMDAFIAGLLCAMMPLLHTHTVLTFAIVFPLLAFLLFDKKYIIQNLKPLGIFFMTTIICAIPLIPLFINHVEGSSSFFKLHLGWMVKDDENLLWFWFKNSYLFVPFAVIALVLPKITNTSIRALQLAGLLLLFVINIALFSPYDWDNVKFLFWAGMFFSLAAGTILGTLFRKNLICVGLGILIVLTMSASALLSLWREVNLQYVLYSKDAIEVGEYIKKNTPRKSTVLTYKLHNSPANNLAGRSIMMGYPGMLWVHGIDYSTREKAIDEILKGSSVASSLLKANNISYILLEDSTPEGMTINRTFFNAYPLLFSNNSYKLYQIQ
jgi:hypothetical protein